MTIQNTKEYMAAMTLEDAMNDYNWSPQKFAESICYMHKTSQQTFIRSIVAAIRKVGSEDY